MDMQLQWKAALAGALFAALAAGPAAAFPAETVETTELREGPDPEFEAVVELPPGTTVEVLNCDANWCEASVEDYDGFLPRDSLDLGGLTPPRYVFPPLFLAPNRNHGRYFSRDHFRYDSRARWRDREGRRLHVVPPRVLERQKELRRIAPQRRDQLKQFEQKKFEKKKFEQRDLRDPQRRDFTPPPRQIEQKKFEKKKFEKKKFEERRLEPRGPAPQRVTPPPQRTTPPPPPQQRIAPPPQRAPTPPPSKGPPPKKKKDEPMERK